VQLGWPDAGARRGDLAGEPRAAPDALALALRVACDRDARGELSPTQ
jgi:hypothetical protein